METWLLEIVINGDAFGFFRALDQNPLLLDSPIVATPYNTPLHVASFFGHEELAGEILRRRPRLANCCDARSLYPLHIAAAKGHVGIAKMILGADSSLSRCRDKDGHTPLHLAAANGHLALLEELLPRYENCSGMVSETGKTVLHLSVKFNQVEVVKVLVEREKELINLKDESGFTALHLASAQRNAQIMKLLLNENSIEVNALNENGFTALDVLLQCPNDATDMEICHLLLSFGAKKGLKQHEEDKQQFLKPKKISRKCKCFRSTDKKMRHIKKKNWLKEMKNTIMIVSTVIAGATFQSGLNPPISDDKNDILFARFLIFDTIALSFSMFIILYLVSGLSLKNRFMTWVLTIMLWASVSTMGITFMIGTNISFRGRDSLNVHLFLGWILITFSIVFYYVVVLFICFVRFLLKSCCSLYQICTRIWARILASKA